jgi:Tol biopolymer transport system component/type II secretory pathway pseudopilin PulG
LGTRQLQSGFSLAEILVSITIVLFIGGGLLNLGARPQGEARASGVAELLEEEFRAARLDAMKDKTYVAIVFPSEGGAKPHASAYYRLEGFQKPRLTRSIDLSAEYPGLSVFVGYWGLDLASLDDSGSGNTTSLARTQEDWDFSSWEAPFPADHHLVFGPEGKVYSSNLPRFDNAYHFLVTGGVEYTGATLDGVRTFTPRQVSAPSTVSVSLAGFVGTSPGVLAQDGSVSAASSTMASSEEPARAATIPAPSSSDPQILSINIFPIPEPRTLPSGVDATVDLRGYLTLRIGAVDVDGDRPFCTWSCEKISGSGSGAGTFSSPQNTQMVRNNGDWDATWEWRPPTDALPGDIYELRVAVTDQTGRTVEGQLGASGRVEVIPSGQIVYERDQDIWIVNADGTGERSLTAHPALESSPAISPEGTRISFVSDRTGTVQLYTMGNDGRNVRLVPISGMGANFWSPPSRQETVSWSPNGNEFLFGLNNPGGSETLLITSADGSSPEQVIPETDCNQVSWHPNLRRALFSGDSHTALGHAFCKKTVVECDLQTGNVIDLIPVGTEWNHRPMFSPNGNQVVFSRGPLSVSFVPVGDFDIMVADYSPGSLANIRKVVDSGFKDLHAAWSPNGDQLVFSSNRTGVDQLYIVDLDGNNLRQLTTGGGTAPHWGRF